MTLPAALATLLLGVNPSESVTFNGLAVRADGGLVIRGLWRFYLHGAFP